MKRIFALIIVLCICVLVAMPVFAVSSSAPAVTDDADLFSEADEKKLEEDILYIKNEYDCDVGIYTCRFDSNFVSDYEARVHCENFYNQNGFSDDGILLMIFFEADDDGGTHMATTGKCMDVFDEDVLYEIEDNFYNYLVYRTPDGYMNAAESFVSDCTAEFYDYTHFDLIWFLLGPGIGAVIAFISVGMMKSTLKSVRSKPNASDYKKSGSMKLTASSDVFLYKNITRVPKPRDSGSGGRSGGRSFGGHSGRRF